MPPVQDDLRDRPIGELLKQLSQETSTLVKQELDLAKAEMTQKGKDAGVGAGFIGAGALFAMGTFGAVTACLIALLATALDHVWLAALIVAVVYGTPSPGSSPPRARTRSRRRRPSPPSKPSRQ